MKIQLNKMTKKYGEKTALDEISLTFPENKLTVILGPSGSGKTTLLKILAGLLFPTSGKIYFDENNVTEIPANKRNVGMVFQKYTLFPHMTVKENLEFPLESQKEGRLFKTRVYDEKEVEKRVDETLELLQLTEHKDKYPSQLSGGEQQRVSIGRELIREPVLFLFDEPLSNIDVRLRHEMRTWIRKVHGIINKTMIYVTHDQTEAMALGNHIILLDEGKIVQEGEPEHLYDKPNTKFAASFIGNYPMNFLPVEYDQNENKVILKDEQIKLSNPILKELKKSDFSSGHLGFRAENIREYDPRKARDTDSLVLECRIIDVENLLDQKVLTLIYENIILNYLTKTKKNFKINDNITILIHHQSLFFFKKNGERIFPN